MRNLIEKFIIIILCLYNAYLVNSTLNLALGFLIAIIFTTSLDLIRSKKIKIAVYLSFLALSFFNEFLIFYIPLIFYNLVKDFRIIILLYLTLLLMNFLPLNILNSLISIYLSFRTSEYLKVLEKSKTAQDELREDTILLRKYNEQLKIDKEKNVQIAILTERNRIARELHDSIGHSISSSILQVEAIKVSSDKSMESSLNLLQETLRNGMEDIRKSIHNLYNESFDLENKIKTLCDEIQSINFIVDYRLDDDIDYEYKYDIFTIVREAVTNSVRHSNATEVRISVLNQVKFYSIIIEDNGREFDKDINSLQKGIGLISMKEIAAKYDGFLTYSFEKGFKVRVILMKGEK